MKEGYLKSECIVLKKSRFKESSALLEIFSPLLGKHSVIAQGIFRKKKTFSSHLEPLSINHIEFFYKESRRMQTITKADLVYYPENIIGDLDVFEYAAKSLRILRKQEYPTESIKQLYGTIKSAIIQFNEKENAMLVYLDFLRSYLFLEGHLSEMYLRESGNRTAYDEKNTRREIKEYERMMKRNDI